MVPIHVSYAPKHNHPACALKHTGSQGFLHNKTGDSQAARSPTRSGLPLHGPWLLWALAGLLATVFLTGCERNIDPLPACPKACAYEPSDVVIVAIESDGYRVEDPYGPASVTTDPAAASMEVHARVSRWQTRHRKPANPILHIVCPSAADLARVAAVFSQTQTWPDGPKAPRRPRALAFRGASGGFASMGFATSDLPGEKMQTYELEGTCGDLLTAAERAAGQGGAIILKSPAQ